MRKTFALALFVLATLFILSAPALATPITVTNLVFPGWQRGGAAARLRAYASADFIASDGTNVIHGTARGTPTTTGFFRETPCTVTGTTLSCTSFSLPTTDDALDNRDARWSLVIFDSAGRVAYETVADQWVLSVSWGASVTFGMWRVYNNLPQRQSPLPGTPNFAQVNAAIAARIVPATTTTLGVVKISVPAVDPANPIAVGDNDPRLSNPALAGGLADPGANGMLARTALGVTAARTITPGSAKITVTNGNGVAGNPVVDIGTLDAASIPALAGDVTGAVDATVLSKIKGKTLNLTPADLVDGQVIAHNAHADDFEPSYLFVRGGYTLASPTNANVVNATSGAGSTVTKTGGVNGTYDAGAMHGTSTGNQIVHRTTISNPTDQICIGLAASNPAGVCAAMAFAVRVNPDGTWTTSQSGVDAFTATTALQSGDVLQIEGVKNKVIIKLNGLINYQFPLSPTYPLVAASAIATAGAQVKTPLVYLGSGQGFFSFPNSVEQEFLRFTQGSAQYVQFKLQTTAPDAPPAGRLNCYANSSGAWACKDSADVVTPMGGGTVTTTGSPASGNLTRFSGPTSITNDDLSGDVLTAGTLVTTLSGGAPAINPAYVTLTDAATVTWATAGARVNNAVVTLGGNRTLSITGAVNGAAGCLVVKQDGTGSRTLALPAGSKVLGATTPGSISGLQSTAASASDILCWSYDGTNYWMNFGKNYN